MEQADEKVIAVCSWAAQCPALECKHKGRHIHEESCVKKCGYNPRAFCSPAEGEGTEEPTI